MKAVTYEKYGPPEVLSLRDLPIPEPKDNEIQVQVRVASVTQTDCIFRRGQPRMSRLFTGLFKPKYPILGDEFAGVVSAVGKDVKQFNVGDEVCGSLAGYGAYAEYICLPETGRTIAIKPAALSFEEAVVCDEGLTALPFLRDTGKLQSGQEVLIVGAAGGIGTAAVQLAKVMGARVTGVCRGENAELVKSLGADDAIDYTKEDFTQGSRQYDVIFDTVGKASFKKGKRVLKPRGVFLTSAISPGTIPQALWSAMFGAKKLKISATGLRPAAERIKDLNYLFEMFAENKYRAVIDRVYPLEEIVDAHRYVDAGHKRGNVVIRISEEGK